jgi:hypothetical protein
LHAANESVAGVYTKWGYKKVFEGVEIEELELSIQENAGQMMYYPLQSDIRLTPRFKEMVMRDATELATSGSYGGSYRNMYKGKGGARRRKHKTRHIRKIRRNNRTRRH